MEDRQIKEIIAIYNLVVTKQTRDDCKIDLEAYSRDENIKRVRKAYQIWNKASGKGRGEAMAMVQHLSKLQSWFENEKNYNTLVVEWKKEGDQKTKTSPEDEFRKLVIGAAIDKVISPEEYQNLLGEARTYGISKRDAEKIIEEIAKRYGAVIEKTSKHVEKETSLKFKPLILIITGLIIIVLIRMISFYQNNYTKDKLYKYNLHNKKLSSSYKKKNINITYKKPSRLRYPAVISTRSQYNLVKITSEPRGAIVMIDKKIVGRTPLTIKLKKGPHGVYLEKKGFGYLADIIKVGEHTRRKYSYRLGKNENKF